MSIAAFIENDLKKRIQIGDTMPASLSLTDLSVHYGVSITPVRNAIQHLVDKGYILKGTNRQLSINSEMVGVGADEDSVDLPLSPSHWDELLLEEVMEASLSLAAVYLREAQIAQKYEVGRSIIRSTLSRFAGAGLVDHVPHKGWLVHPFREEDVEDYLAVREVLELMALDRARDHMTKREVEAILESEQHALNNALHRYIIECSGNRYIKEFFGQYVARYYTKLFYYAAPGAAVVDEMTAQHESILQNILCEDWDAAGTGLAEHIRAQKQVLRRLLVGEHERQLDS